MSFSCVVRQEYNRKEITKERKETVKKARRKEAVRAVTLCLQPSTNRARTTTGSETWKRFYVLPEYIHLVESIEKNLRMITTVVRTSALLSIHSSWVSSHYKERKAVVRVLSDFSRKGEIRRKRG